MNDKKRQEIFRHDSRWVNEYDDGKIRIDHWDENKDVIRIGTVMSRYIEHWAYDHYHWIESHRTMYHIDSNGDKELLRRLIP